jgi:hypothetical protein
MSRFVSRWILSGVLTLSLLPAQDVPKPPSPQKPTKPEATSATPPAQKPAAPSKPQHRKKETPAEWLHRVTGIDLRAYRNMTAVRQENGVDAAARLVEYDRVTRKEQTLWACDGCWSPGRIEGATLVLRQATDDPAAAELWLVRDRTLTTRRVASIRGAAGIVGSANGRTYVGALREWCASSSDGPFGMLAVDLAKGTVTELTSAPCFGPASLVSKDRVRRNRYLATTRRSDLSGNPRPRQLLVMAPANGTMPTASYFDERLTSPPDRYDAVWIDDNRIVYLATP